MSPTSPSALHREGHVARRDVAPEIVAAPASTTWELSRFAGRLGEICGGRSSAALTLAFRLVLDAQRRGEPVAWVVHPDRAFYPPDVADAAVDVEALVVVWATGPLESSRAADRLLRSGGFGLVVLDLGPAPRLSLAILGRLMGLARKHRAAVIFLTESDREDASLGSLISLRARALRSHVRDHRYRVQAHVLKDKRRGPSWRHAEIGRGPDGLH